jgi:hypothetical protein
MKPAQADQVLRNVACLTKDETSGVIAVLFVVELASVETDSDDTATLQSLQKAIEAFKVVGKGAFCHRFVYPKEQDVVVACSWFPGGIDDALSATIDAMGYLNELPADLSKYIRIGIGTNAASAFGLARMRAELVALIHQDLHKAIKKKSDLNRLRENNIYPPDYQQFNEGLNAALDSKLANSNLKREIRKAGKSAAVA